MRVDPELSVLAIINFAPPESMLSAQLVDKKDLVGRLIAAEQFGAKRDRGAVARLKESLNNDAFYGVRLAASQALRAIQTDEAYEALLASTKQSDARVRRHVLSDIAGFYREGSYAAAKKVLEEEKNPDIKALALVSLGAYGKPEIHEKLLDALNSTSYRNILADAAINAMRAQDDPSYIGPLRETLQKKETAFTTAGFSRALENLAHLARNEEKKDSLREFFVGYVNSNKKRVQLAALNGLGTLGDSKAIAVLEKFTNAGKESPERIAAEKSLASLRDAKKPSVELGQIRNEVLNLQKENRALRKDFDDLKKKLEATAPAAASRTNKTATPLKSPKRS